MKVAAQACVLGELNCVYHEHSGFMIFINITIKTRNAVPENNAGGDIFEMFGVIRSALAPGQVLAMHLKTVS